MKTADYSESDRKKQDEKKICKESRTYDYIACMYRDSCIGVHAIAV